jgi:hypothetical protein
LLLPGVCNTLRVNRNPSELFTEIIAAEGFGSEEYFAGQERVNIKLDDGNDPSLDRERPPSKDGQPSTPQNPQR